MPVPIPDPAARELAETLKDPLARQVLDLAVSGPIDIEVLQQQLIEAEAARLLEDTDA